MRIGRPWKKPGIGEQRRQVGRAPRRRLRGDGRGEREQESECAFHDPRSASL